ncbi:hypothetical protein MUK42_16535 [Musa troglodytarum]|uniref:Uncharacterized protein n=1 Tax=Musa troglodytarum TaxID=320322 RepID=A0A9E7L0N6_9LILI|nr:hypothetical protein MUK42_16535 [Musa troglodytarum]
MESKESNHEDRERDSTMPVKLNARAPTRVEKNRELQEDLTDDMLKESRLLMVQSLQDTEKVLRIFVVISYFSLMYSIPSGAVEHGLASPGHAMAVCSESLKTTCSTWLVISATTLFQ